MITHTSDSHQIPSQNKTKSKLQIQKIAKKSKFWNFEINFTCDTPSEVVKIWNGSNQNCRQYRADTECWKDGRTDGRTNVLTDGQTDGVKPIYPPTTFLCGGYDNISARNPFYWGDRNIMELDSTRRKASEICLRPLLDIYSHTFSR